ncbi:hypothetical protein HVIM_04225 [Roseomonas mucosa]|nr:hypothetical protein HVIM_04225 [Roseomonas mucosa]QDD99097.1 hypothetical protein ADP8_04225 [Roseomonas mucosa]UZO91292.1 hypothetical protein RMP42_04225 [Roseomonas mucosa]
MSRCPGEADADGPGMPWPDLCGGPERAMALPRPDVETLPE